MALTPPKVRVFLSTFSMLNVPPLPERSVVDAGNWDLASNNPRQRSRKFPSFPHRRPRRKEEEEEAITADASSERINYCCSQFDALWGKNRNVGSDIFFAGPPAVRQLRIRRCVEYCFQMALFRKEEQKNRQSRHANCILKFFCYCSWPARAFCLFPPPTGIFQS